MPAWLDRVCACLLKTLALPDALAPGERIAAPEAVSSQREELGLRWRDIVAELPAVADEEALYTAPAAELMRDRQGILSPRDARFLVGTESLDVPSAKQRAQLAGVRRKIEAARAARAAA
jgi:hypothetical protein